MPSIKTDIVQSVVKKKAATHYLKTTENTLQKLKKELLKLSFSN